MIPNEVKVGSKFYTRISQVFPHSLVEVVEDTREGTKRYRVRRLDTGAILRKLRGAGELHSVPGPWTRSSERGVPAASRKAPPSGPRLKPLVKTQSDLLAQLITLPDDTRTFLSELISSMTSTPIAGKKVRGV